MDEEIRKGAAEGTPADRIAEQEDIADAVCFLLQNPNVTGEVYGATVGRD